MGFSEDSSAPYCYWDAEASGITTSQGGVGKTTNEMQTASTFTSGGWDFNTIWGIDEGTSYPYLLSLSAQEGEGEGNAIEFLTVDINANHIISLSELLRAIQLYNSAGYHCQADTEDGYAPYSGDTSCTPSNSDYNPVDWVISLSELLRLVQLYNSGAYHACPGSEDGFCPGL
ncbi:MAG TPA: hypothetical protein PLI09_07495 [Candidatus Hydrogenedentes bacterium]|nr:hypothetical protein [Candidatus Hydrogenedentota bacterium]